MAYIGNIPAVQYASFSKQTLTADSSTVAFTLDNAVANENELEVFVNNVRQEPGSGKAYTASGTTLTMSAAPTTGDSFYVIFQGKATQTVTPGSGTVTNAMLAGSIDLTSKVTGVLPVANSQVMTPAFEAHLGTSQTVTDNVTTKIQFDTEVFDTDGCYDNATNYRFTPTVAGKYFVYAKLSSDTISGANLDQLDMRIRKNGATLSMVKLDARGNTLGSWCTVNDATVVDMNGTTDYLEVFGTIDDTSGNPDFYNGDRSTNFGAFRITGV